ncbi:MAG: hypothetical protein GX564_09845, partial [Oligosphaeraceae bacterium]|nr:hypothetical protein [Oligosphaeraceae bacterium]
KQAGQAYIDTRHTVDPAKKEDFQKRAAANAFGKAMRTYGDADFQKKIAEHLRKNNQAINDQWQKDFEKAMGYDDPATSPWYVDPGELGAQVSKTLNGLSDIKLPELKFDNTKAWGEQFRQEAGAAFAKSAGVLKDADTGGRRRAAIEKREEDLQRYRQGLIDDPELAKYRREGWNKKGEERRGPEAADARELHWRRVPLIRREVSKVDQALKQLDWTRARVGANGSRWQWMSVDRSRWKLIASDSSR